MTDHDALGHSLILTSMEILMWQEKGVMVATSGTMLLGKTSFEISWAKKGFGIHYGIIL